MENLNWKTYKKKDLSIKKGPAAGREEYLDYMTFRCNGRTLFTEIFGPLIGLKEEWEEQGASPEELNFSGFRYLCEPRRGYLPVNTGREGGYPEEIIDETEEHLLWRDGLGRTMKLNTAVATRALPLDYPVKNMDDWLKIKHWYEFSAKRLSPNCRDAAGKILEEDRTICVSIPGGFDQPRQLMGEENLCMAYHDQPELVHDILNTIAETAFKVLEIISREVRIDILSVHEDMAGKSGPLVGPVNIREFIAPYYQRIWGLLKERGCRIFDQDSDGNMNPVIESFLSAGVNCMHPMEPAAGMDIVKIRKKYGARLAFYGGIDKHVLRGTRNEILDELEYKIPPMVKSGGCVLGLDHRIPNGTPIENYRFYVNKVWEIIEDTSLA